MQSKTPLGAARFKLVLASVALIIVCLAAIPSVSATASITYMETFEDDATFFPQPCDRTGATVAFACKSNPFYTMGDSSHGYAVASPGNPGKSFAFDAGGSFVPFYDPCALASAGSTDVDVDFYTGTVPTGSIIGFHSTSGSYWFDGGLQIKSTGVPRVLFLGITRGVVFADFAGATALSANTWYHVTLSLTDALPASAGCGTFQNLAVTISGTGYGPFGNHVSTGAVASSNVAYQALVWRQYTGGTDDSPAGTPSDVAAGHYWDNLAITPPSGVVPTSTGTAGSRFCANVLDEPDFGWEYTDGLRSLEEAVDDEAVKPEYQISMDDGFAFVGYDASSSWDVAAKHFTTGSKAMHVFFQIESGVDATDSTFRVIFTLNSNSIPDATTRGNMLDTQLFDDQYEVQFRENGNDWNIQLFKAEAGGNRVSQGPSINTGNPNNPELYSFWLDTRAGSSYAAVKNAARTDLINTTSSLIPDIPSSFSEDSIYNQWFIGYGSGEVLGVDVNAEAVTALNDNKEHGEDSGDSTCIFDDVGTAIVGSGGAGTLPGSLAPGEVDSPSGPSTEGNIFTPLIASASGLFGGSTVLGGIFVSALLILGFGGIGYDAFGGSVIGGGTGSVLGLVLALAMGIFPLWPVLIFVVACIALIFLHARG